MEFSFSFDEEALSKLPPKIQGVIRDLRQQVNLHTDTHSDSPGDHSDSNSGHSDYNNGHTDQSEYEDYNDGKDSRSYYTHSDSDGHADSSGHTDYGNGHTDSRTTFSQHSDSILVDTNVADIEKISGVIEYLISMVDLSINDKKMKNEKIDELLKMIKEKDFQILKKDREIINLSRLLDLERDKTWLNKLFRK